jgi:hypothetical protein
VVAVAVDIKMCQLVVQVVLVEADNLDVYILNLLVAQVVGLVVDIMELLLQLLGSVAKAAEAAAAAEVDS